MTPLAAEYKEFYARELQRREELNSSIERPMAIITALVGIMYYCMHDLPGQLTTLTAMQIIVGTAAAFLLAIAIIEIVWSNYDHTYGFIPTPASLEDYRRKLTEYHTHDRKLSAEKIEQKVLEYIYTTYAEAGHQNANINDQRSAHLHRAKKSIIFALPVICLLVALRILGSDQCFGWFSELAGYAKGIVT